MLQAPHALAIKESIVRANANLHHPCVVALACKHLQLLQWHRIVSDCCSSDVFCFTHAESHNHLPSPMRMYHHPTRKDLCWGLGSGESLIPKPNRCPRTPRVSSAGSRPVSVLSKTAAVPSDFLA